MLGGTFGADVQVYRSISQADPAQMARDITEHRARGLRAWQLKVGGDDPDLDIERIQACVEAAAGDPVVADANTGWLTHQALKVVDAVRDLGVAIEQPCPTYEECLTVRRATALPIVLDECVDGPVALVRAYTDGAMDVVNIKIGKVGGLTRARHLRDLCVRLGIAVTVEDMPGGDITGATIVHLAHSTPQRYRYAVTSSYLKVSTSIAAGGPVVVDGRTAANTGPGLGVEPRLEVLGDRVFELTGTGPS